MAEEIIVRLEKQAEKLLEAKKKLRAENERLRKVLAFYANEHNYLGIPVGRWVEPSPIKQDEGKLAREALEK